MPFFRGLDSLIHGVCRSAVNVLNLQDDPSIVYRVYPDGSSGNVNNPNGEISFNFSAGQDGSKDQLKGALQNSGNFFWLGHGNPKQVGPRRDDSETPALTAGEIAVTLDNVTRTNGYKVNNPFKLVVLVGCNAYSKDLADAFGIDTYTSPRPNGYAIFPLSDENSYLAAGRSTNSVDYYNSQLKSSQAFVGWPVTYYGITDDSTGLDDATWEEASIALLFSKWQQGKTITECMLNFSAREATRFHQGGDEGLGIANDLKWELSGCWDLKTIHRE